MLNNWKWKRSDNSSYQDEYWLYDDNEKSIAFVYRKCYDGDIWECYFFVDNFGVHFSVTFENIKSAERALLQATLWIYNNCNQVANNFHYIRDHLPSLHELREQSEIVSTFE